MSVKFVAFLCASETFWRQVERRHKKVLEAILRNTTKMFWRQYDLCQTIKLEAVWEMLQIVFGGIPKDASNWVCWRFEKCLCVSFEAFWKNASHWGCWHFKNAPVQAFWGVLEKCLQRHFPSWPSLAYFKNAFYSLGWHYMGLLRHFKVPPIDVRGVVGATLLSSREALRSHACGLLGCVPHCARRARHTVMISGQVWFHGMNCQTLGPPVLTFFRWRLVICPWLWCAKVFEQSTTCRKEFPW